MMTQRNLELMDGLAEQCKTCRIGQKPIGKRSGCDIHKKLITDRNEVAWKHIHLFLDGDGKCKNWKPCNESRMEVATGGNQGSFAV